MIQEDLNKQRNPRAGSTELPPQFQASMLRALEELDEDGSEEDDRPYMAPSRPAPASQPAFQGIGHRLGNSVDSGIAVPSVVANAPAKRTYSTPISNNTGQRSPASPTRTPSSSQPATTSPHTSSPTQVSPRSPTTPSPPRRLPMPVGVAGAADVPASQLPGRATQVPVAIDDTALLRRMFNRGPYVPKVESGNWAILIALFIHTAPGVSLEEPVLKNMAERYSAYPMTPTGNSVFSAWSNIKKLVEERLIVPLTAPKRYSLTPSGRELAESLWKDYNGEGDAVYDPARAPLNPVAAAAIARAANGNDGAPSRRLPAASQSVPTSPNTSPPRPKRAGRRKNDEGPYEAEDAHLYPRAVGIPLPGAHPDFTGAQFLTQEPGNLGAPPPKKKRAKKATAAAAPVEVDAELPSTQPVPPSVSSSQSNVRPAKVAASTLATPSTAAPRNPHPTITAAQTHSPPKPASAPTKSTSPTKSSSPEKATSVSASLPSTQARRPATTVPVVSAKAVTAQGAVSTASLRAAPPTAADQNALGTQPTWRHEFYLASDPNTLQSFLRPVDGEDPAPRPPLDIPPLVSQLEFVPLSQEYLDIPLTSHTIQQVICIVDGRERRNLGEYPQDYFQLGLEHEGVNVRTIALSVGDFLWVGLDENSQLIVLDSIIERKCIEDWGLSMIDGRLNNQKWRLRHTGLSKLYIAAEGIIDPERLNYPVEPDNMTQSISNTTYGEPFIVLRPRDPRDTIRYLVAMTNFLESRYLNNTVFTTSPEAIETLKVRHHGVTDFERYERCIVDDSALCWTFDQFQSYFKKVKPLHGSDLFAYQLMSLSGISGMRAAAIVSEWQSLPNLLAAYSATPTREDRVALIADVKVNGRKLGTDVGTLVMDTLVGNDL